MYNYNLLESILFLPTNLNNEKLRKAIRGKTILITGASSGIGEQVAFGLAKIDVHLILVARREDKLLTMKMKIEQQGTKVSIFRTDLRNAEEMAELLMFLQHLPNGLDVVVSNAGLSINRSLKNSLNRYHDFTRTMAINYFAPVQLLLSVIPLLEKNKGQIINVSTVNVLLLPFPHWAGYQASKSAFDTWLRSAAPELKTMGVCTSTIYLPLVKTPMIAPTAAYKKMPAMAADHVAAIICQRMYTKKNVYRPWWLPYGQLASLFCRGLWEANMPNYLRRKKGEK